MKIFKFSFMNKKIKQKMFPLKHDLGSVEAVEDFYKPYVCVWVCVNCFIQNVNQLRENGFKL